MKLPKQVLIDNFNEVWGGLSEASRKYLCLAAMKSSNESITLAFRLAVANDVVPIELTEEPKSKHIGLTTFEIADLYGLSRGTVFNYTDKLICIDKRPNGKKGAPSKIYSMASVEKLAEERGWVQSLATKEIKQLANETFTNK